MKKILAVILAIFMTISLLGCSINSNRLDSSKTKPLIKNPESDFEVRPDTVLGGVVITKFIGNSKRIWIPEIIKNEPVVGIDRFSNLDRLTEIILPNTLKRIGDEEVYTKTSMFGRELASINIPDSVTWISNYAFMNCEKLTSITISDNVTYIGKGAFENCKGLTDITIGNGIIAILNDTFSGCENLATVKLPDSLVAMGYFAFSRCVWLKSITLPDKLQYASGTAFSSCSGLSEIKFKGKTYNVNEKDIMGWIIDNFEDISKFVDILKK